MVRRRVAFSASSSSTHRPGVRPGWGLRRGLRDHSRDSSRDSASAASAGDVERLHAEDTKDTKDMQDMTLVELDQPPVERPCSPSSVTREPSLATQVAAGLAPLLALLVVALMSVLGALSSSWRPPPSPPPSAQSCLGRILAAVLPAWSGWDDSPLVRPF
ncbi:uncharacterized protein LOC117638912 [Thrips palmi]|uniref:Uncharacterized protein LOC117638912 n=1 Tax=Thrips palmi TaxID=161013 RepID=A0A6P8XSY1_THRPL|nr:uncharacterized protein LOC117638912 [Thrips palmi]